MFACAHLLCAVCCSEDILSAEDGGATVVRAGYPHRHLRETTQRELYYASAHVRHKGKSELLLAPQNHKIRSPLLDCYAL
jgi:hypothetical protein